MPKCEKCGGREVLEKEGKLYECICAFLRRISASMPPYIRKAEVLPEHLELPIMNAVGRSIYVTATWTDMKAIIKACMIKHPAKFIKISSDAEIRDVFVGSKSKAAKSSDYEGEIYNNLSDLMDPPDLMVVRLNELAYKNKAAAGALEEALSYRLDRDKSTWVFSNVNRRFVRGSFAYSDSVAELLSTGFLRMILPEISETPSVDEGLFADPVSSGHGEGLPGAAQLEDTGPPDEPPEPKDGPEEAYENPDSDSGGRNPISRYGQGISRKSSRGFRGRS